MPYPAADYTRYPDADDLTAFLEGAGLSATGLAGVGLAAACSAAARAWQQRTHYAPFVAGPEATEREFDAPDGASGRLLELNAGLLELESLTVDEEEYTVGEDFVLLERSARAQGMPYTQIRFARRVSCAPGGVVITGRWGFCDELPPEVWNAILSKAASLLAPQLALQVSRGLVSVSDALLQKTIQFGSSTGSPITAAGETWAKAFEDALSAPYILITL